MLDKDKKIKVDSEGKKVEDKDEEKETREVPQVVTKET
jgi:hypothetical protein